MSLSYCQDCIDAHLLRGSACQTPLGGFGLAWWRLEQRRAMQNSKLGQLLISPVDTHKLTGEGTLPSLPAGLSSPLSLVPRWRGGVMGGATSIRWLSDSEAQEVSYSQVTPFFFLSSTFYLKVFKSWKQYLENLHLHSTMVHSFQNDMHTLWPFTPMNFSTDLLNVKTF